MSDILSKIAAGKLKEVAEREQLYPVKLLEKSLYFATQPVSLKRYLLREDKCGVIAEFKRFSPSRGAINPHEEPEKAFSDGQQTLSFSEAERLFDRLRQTVQLRQSMGV